MPVGRPREVFHKILEKISQFGAESQDEIVLFRGQASSTFAMEPSVFRKSGRFLENEHHMFNEMMATNPKDFSNDSSTFDRLVRAQHYGLPTRLLDVTFNPLVALYFACCEMPKSAGQVIMFKFRVTDVLPPTSDKVSVLSNLSRLDHELLQSIDTTLDLDAFNQTDAAKKLVHFIREEKSFFRAEIVPSDVNRVLCVRAKLNHERILAQSGAFLIFGNNSKLAKSNANEVVVATVEIQGKSKANIMNELGKLNINERALFPEIERSALHIRKKYLYPPPVTKACLKEECTSWVSTYKNCQTCTPPPAPRRPRGARVAPPAQAGQSVQGIQPSRDPP